MSSKNTALASIDAAAKASPIKPRLWTPEEDEILLHGWGKVDNGILKQILNDYQRANNLRIRTWEAIRWHSMMMRRNQL